MSLKRWTSPFKSRLATAPPCCKPRLLSYDGPSYIAGELAEYIKANKMSHVRGAPMHPQTQGKIERWYQSLKNRILLENYFLPGDLEAPIEAFVEHDNHQRYHESLNNVTPADACFCRAPTIIEQRERIKRQTIEHRLATPHARRMTSTHRRSPHSANLRHELRQMF